MVIRESTGAHPTRFQDDDVIDTLEPVTQQDDTLLVEIDDDGITRHIVAFGFLPGEQPAGEENLAR